MKLKSFNKCFWILLSLVLYENILQAQPLKSSSGLAVKTWVKNGNVQLRWAPSNSTLWKYGNKYGYLIERYAIHQKSSSAPVLLTTHPIKPLPEAEWEKLFLRNSLAAVGAHVLYAKDGDVNGMSGINHLIDQSREKEQKFMLGMMVANQDTALAKASGLYFVDHNLDDDKKHLYKIFIDLPGEITVKYDTGYVLIDPSQESQLVAPTGLMAKWEDQKVELKWPQKIYQDVFESYWLEKSIDGINFNSLSTLPLINLQVSKNQEYQFWTDSLKNNHDTYYYRLRGKDWFGNLSPYGKVISGKGRSPFQLQPVIYSGTPMSSGIELKWRIDNYKPTNELRYQLTRCHQPGDAQIMIIKEGWVLTDTCSFIDEHPGHENYYQVNILKDDQIRQSTPWQVMLPDTIPPAAPVHLNGSIDTLGIVALEWQRGEESDLAGYQVYRGDHLKSEYSLISKKIVHETFFTDTINLHSLDSAIHYKILALDQYYNRSSFSTPVTIKKPDLIPPQPPAISSISNEKNGIKISWKPQNDAVGQYFLFRKVTDGEWQCIYQNIPGVYSYLDSGVMANQGYEYTMIARDKAGNDSSPASSKYIKRSEVNLGIAFLKAYSNRENGGISLSWNHMDKVSKVRIFRSIADEPLRAYRTKDSQKNSFEDNNVNHNQQYNYRIQFIWENGGVSSLSNEVSLKYR